MKNIFKKIWSILLVCLMLCSMGTQALAADDHSIRVRVLLNGELPVSDIEVEVCQVIEKRQGSFVLTDAFSAAGFSSEAILADPDAEKASSLCTYAFSHAISGQTSTTDLDGEVFFQGLSEGVYLVYERGEQSVCFNPYLITLPNAEGDREVMSVPKVSENGTKQLKVTVLWDDNNDSDRIRPSRVNVKLLREEEPTVQTMSLLHASPNNDAFAKTLGARSAAKAIRSVWLSPANEWKHIFTDLPNTGIYSIEEPKVEGYSSTVYEVSDGWVIIYSHETSSVPDKAHVSVRKVWDDDGDRAGRRPASVTVQLIEQDTVIKTAVLNSNNSWSYVFEDLDPDKAYSIHEIKVKDYTASYSGNAACGFVITNTYGTSEPSTPPEPSKPEVERVDIKIEKRWEDNNNASGKRPVEITVRLLTGGSIAGTAKLNEENGWKYTFTDLPGDYVYSVWEDPVGEYSVTYEGTADRGFIITNTYAETPVVPDGPSDPSEDMPIPPEPSVEPVDPSEPAEPIQPTIPQTGAYTIPIYFLLAVGIVLILLGAIDMRKGRKSE